MSGDGRRWLRPARVVVSGDAVWLVDQDRPAAVAMHGDRQDLRFWSGEVGGWFGPTCVADGVGGIVVQDAVQLHWVGDIPGSVDIGRDELTLAAADSEVAWLVDNGELEYAVPGRRDPTAVDVPDESGDVGGRIVAVDRGGRRTETSTALPVRDVRVDGDELIVVFAERPVAHERDGGWLMEYPKSELRTPRSQLLAGQLLGSPAPRAALSPGFDLDNVVFADDDSSAARWAWLESDVSMVLRYGVHVAGWVWWAGADREGSAIDRQVLIRAHDPGNGRVRVGVDAGPGLVSAVTAVGDELWVVIARQRLSRVARSRGVEVIAVSRDGAVRTVLPPDSVDISITNPPMRPEPTHDEVAIAVELITSQFDDVDNYWRAQDGSHNPLARGMSDVSVTVERTWPDTAVVISFHHPSRLGLRLQRRYRVFDETGRHETIGDLAIDLMEDLDTGYLTPADEAIDGVLIV